MSPRLGAGSSKARHTATNGAAANGAAKRGRKRKKIHPLSGAALAAILTAPGLIIGLQHGPPVTEQARGAHLPRSRPMSTPSRPHAPAATAATPPGRPRGPWHDLSRHGGHGRVGRARRAGRHVLFRPRAQGLCRHRGASRFARELEGLVHGRRRRALRRLRTDGGQHQRRHAPVRRHRRQDVHRPADP